MLLQFFCHTEISFLCSLANPQLPVSIGHNICVKYIGANIKGVMWLIVFHIFRYLCLRNFSCQKHTTGFSSNCTTSYHPVTKHKIIFRFKILFYKFSQSFILSHSTADNLIFCIFTEMSLRIFHFCHIEKTVMAVIVLILTVYRNLLQSLIVSTHTHSIFHSHKSTCTFFITMGQKHFV